ncbi:Contains similarity to gb/AF092102 G-protein beta subunit git5p from Schizosaccharomyces pombe and contains 2 PF/00400WD domain, G-beta repeat domains [Arabidopsis thaliana]|uniref:WD repeat-containing protein 76 n=1 Tax=Arabidopsis thaliana TaxID=3702 RepID=Q9SAI7_ARATH|nr:DROUGHT SENSITIVE 1 [Arabidopsis thaliana]AAF14658.1 Contains similarity to gb/AF092102 G-protein beta subunit git5p from Schizosaccharomyces pombe and contains 2 PF/00400WD domain, G-beta repeat domains [Arabidopsis thaliana]AEE36439.1 DROUGHT SENSITIVE 1 [Arabidopsis thaliana]|eukprot:NP_178186.1 DROUGHT SENSITIVE 1 [Arabidopsis thaliana]
MATEYERKRLENIRRNDEMLAALNVRAKASSLLSAAKRSRDDSKSFKKKKPKPASTPTVIRMSLRTRGLNPDSAGLPDGFSDFRMGSQITHNQPSPQKQSPRLLAPIPFESAYEGYGSYTQLVDTLLGIESKSCRGKLVKGEIGVVKDENESPMVRTRSSSRVSKVSVKKEEPEDDSFSDYVNKEFSIPVKPEKIEFDLDLLTLEPQNVARVVPGRIFVVQFLPCENVKMVAAGDKLGNVGFWNLDCGNEEDNDGIYLFTPHSAPVSSIVFQQNSLSRVISSSYDGLIRLMDVEKSVFDLVYSTDEAIFSLSQRPNDEQSLYFGQDYGVFNVWDLRAGKSVFHWELHERRINSIDFNPQNPHVMATSSTDGTACLWDLRSMGAKKPKTLSTVNHSRAVHSAYFSPSGLSLATTSLDNYIGVLSGANFENTCMIYHNNTSRWISKFKAVWGWDDSYIYVGNLSKKIDVINPKLKRTVMELHNPLQRAIPCRIHCHPYNVGTLAGSTAGGQVYVWTTK